MAEPPSAPSTADRIKLFLVTAGYAGLAPKAPGTFGTLVALAIDAAWFAGGFDPVWLRLTFAGLASLGCVLLGTWCEAYWGKKDPQTVVLDEVAGYFLASAMTGPWHGWGPMVSCFLLFRAGDVLKPFPINRLQDFPRGWGVVLDDLGAGALAGFIVWLLWAL